MICSAAPRSNSAGLKSAPRRKSNPRAGRALVAARRSRYNARMPRTRKTSPMHGTTVLCVRRDAKVVMAGDGQVTLGEGVVVKHAAKKIRRLYSDKILAGFAGSTADALSLFGRFEAKLQEHHGNLPRSAVELAKEWRTDRALRHLDALLVVADGKSIFLLSGHGDIIEPDDGICAIGTFTLEELCAPCQGAGSTRTGKAVKDMVIYLPAGPAAPGETPP